MLPLLTLLLLAVAFTKHAASCEQVDCWRERVSNVTELDHMITAYPVLLSYSLDTTVSRLDFLIQVCLYFFFLRISVLNCGVWHEEDYCV